MSTTFTRKLNMPKKDIQYIKTLLTTVLNVDFLPYKDSTVMRRVEKRMKVLQLTKVKDYIDHLKNHEQESRLLGEDIFINVTDFFRDPHVFQKIKHKILPIIFSQEKRTVKFWVVGCATGEEAYSMAILIKEFCEENNYTHKIKIIATDIKEEAINKARQGIYTIKEILGVSRQRLRRFFDREGDKYRIKKQIRTEVIFAIHDITADPPFARVDLLSCRNLLIYLDKENQQKVLASLVFALNIQGFLVLGKSETAIDLAYDLKNISSAYKIYKRIKNTRTTRRLHFDISYQDSLLPVLVPPNENEAGMKEHQLAQSFQHIIHQKYAPAVVIIDEQFYVKYITHAAKQYIDTPEDYTKIYSLTVLAPEAVTALVRAAISEIKKGKSVNAYPPIPITYEGQAKQISITVESLTIEADKALFYAINFEENHGNSKPSIDVAERINLALQDQLADTEENLRKTIEKLENTNQNLLASNEELQSTNEEYISVNEELQTINSEYQATISELSISNKDVDHLLQSTDIGTVFLDDKLHIRKFTNPIKKLINIDDIDLKRPLKNFTHNLKNINIYKEVKIILDSNQAIEKEVVSENDIHYLMRATTYDVDEGNRKGIILSFINIQQLIEAKIALAESELLYRSVFDYANEGIMLYNRKKEKIVNANKRHLDILGYTDKEKFLTLSPEDMFAEVQADGEKLVPKVKHYRKLNKSKDLLGIEWTMKRQDGTLIETEINTVRMPDSYEGYFLHIIRDITQRKKAQAEILSSQKRFEAVFDNAPIGVGISSIKSRSIIRVNKTFGRMMGYTPKQLSQMSFVDITHHEDRQQVWQYLKPLLSDKKKVITFDKRYVKKNGNIFWARLWVSVMDDGSGEKFFVSSMRDITEEKEIQKALQDSELRYRSLFEKNIDAVLIYDIKNNKILSANKSAVQLFDCSRKYLLARTPMDFFPEFQGNGEPSMQFFGKQVQNYEQTGEIRHFMQLQTKKGKPIEVEVTAFPLDDSPDSEMVVQFRNITEQKTAQKALQESEQRFRSIYENSGEAILIKDLTRQKVTQFNSKFTEMTGYTEEDFSKLSGAEITLEPQADGRSAYTHHEEHMQALNEKGYCFVENWLLIHKDGHIIHTNMSLSRLYEDRDDAIVVQFRDVTERYQAQQALQSSEQRFRSLFENSADALAIMDSNTLSIIDCNEYSLKLYRTKKKEVIGLNAFKLSAEIQIDGRPKIEHLKEITNIVNNKGHHLIEKWRSLRPDGTEFYSEFSVSRLPAPDEHLYILQIRDITEKLQAQQAIEESEERFRNLFENSAIGIGVFDVENMIVIDCNHQFAALHGRTIAEFKKVQPQDITPDIQADGRNTMTHLQEQIEATIKNGSHTVNNWLSKRKDDTIFHTEVTLNTLNEHTPNIIFVHMHDITEKLTAQKALQDSEQRFRSLFENSAIGIGVFDVENMTVLDCNHQYAELYGFTIAEFKKTKPQDATPAIQADGRDTMTHLHEQVEAVRKNGSHTVNNWLSKRKDGTIFNTETTLNILNENTPNIVFAYMRDITEKLTAQKALQESEEQFRSLFEHSADAVSIIDFPKNIFLDTNKKSLEMFGYSKEELMTKTPKDLSATVQADGRSTSKHIKELITTVKKYGYYFIDNWINKRADGTEFYSELSVTNFPAPNEHIFVIQRKDITEKLQARQEIQRINTILANTDDVIGMVSMNSKKIIYLNTAGQKKLGRSVEKLQNVNPYDFFSEQEAERMVNLIIPHIAKFGTWQGEIRINDKFTGHEYLISVNIIGHFSDDQQLEYLSGIARDITEKRKQSIVLHGITRYIAEAYNEDLVPAIVKSIAVSFNLTGCVICDAVSNNGYQNIISMYWDGHYQSGQLPCDKMPCAKIYTEGTQIYTEGVQQLFPVLNDYFDPPIESYIGIPIYNSENQITAHIAVFDRKPIESTDFIQATLQIYASRIGADLERVEKEKALQKQKDYLNTIINLTPAMITAKDTAGNFILANQAAAGIYSVPVEKLIGKNRREFDFGFGVKKSLTSDKKVIETGKIQYYNNAVLNMANGDKRIFQIIKVPLKNNDGEIIQVVAIATDITEIKTAEKLLKEQKDYLRTIIDLAPNYVFSKNINGEFVLANKAIATVYGTTPVDMEGKTDADFNPNKGEVQFFLQKDKETMQKGKIIHIPEEVITTTTGETKILQTTKVPMFDDKGNCEQILGISVDITEFKQIERDLRESQIRFKATFENSYSIILIVDADGNLIEQNKPLRQGGDIYDKVGQPIWSSEWFLHDKKVVTQIKKDFKKVMKGEYVVGQCTYLRTPDQIGYMSYSGKPVYLEEGGDLLFILAEARDITDLMLAQKELGVKIDELNIKNEELKKYIDSNMQLENFAYITSHDLREPLRTISGFANLLERKYSDKLDNTATEYLNYIITSTKNMNALIQDLLIFSRAHTGEHKVEEIQLIDLLEQITKSIGRSIQETDAKIQFKNIPKTISANETKMKQLFQNLISNAIKFRKPDTNPEIIISAKSKGKLWEFAIQDNGIGIKNDYYDKIFMIFKRLHTKNEYEGTGIGLSLCKKIVEQHGGEIYLKSKFGEGTTFYFTIEK